MKLIRIFKIQNITLQKDISSWMFYVLIFLVISMPLSEFGMTISQLTLLLLWIHEGISFTCLKEKVSVKRYLLLVGHNLRQKLNLLLNNKMLLIVIAFYLMHIVGLIYTSDFTYAFKDLRIKLPLLILPLIFASINKLNKQKLSVILTFFIYAVVAGTLVSIYVKTTRDISDTRDISIFISHIRFSLMICFSIFILAFFLVKRIHQPFRLNFLFAILLVWLFVFLFILKALTGLLILTIIILYFLFNYVLSNRRLIPISAVLVIVLTSISWLYMKSIVKDLSVAEPVEIKELDQKTSHGNLYIHDTLHYGIEYGSHVGLYIAELELEKAWNERSSIDYRGLDKKGQYLSQTLIRYLHSKGLRKDANGLEKLDPSEIKQVENGVANANYLKSFSVRSMIEQFLHGYLSYKEFNDPNASSFMQRLEYWKTSVYLIKNEPIWGYGTGDIELAFKQAYNKTNSRLDKKYQHRSHNQFLATYIALGIPGLLIFISGLIFPPLRLNKFANFIYIVFFLTVILSMLTEDTLETQPGATFFAFFNSLLLFGLTKEADLMCNLNKSS